MKVRTSVLRGFALLALGSLTFAACDNKTTEVPPPPVTVTVTPSTLNLTAGQTGNLVAVVQNATNTAVTWESANTAVATVSATGQVTAVAQGTATITATSQENTNARGAAAVVVTAAPPPVITLELVPATASVQVNGTVQLVSIVGGTTNTAVTYTSTSPGIATVSTTGLVTGVAPGTAVITATTVATPSVTRTSTITVTAAPPPEQVQITLTPTAPTIGVGGTQQFVATVTGSTNQDVIWRSASEDVATINQSGLATGVSAGTSVITAIAAADTTRRVQATLTVQASTQPSISIQNVINQATGLPVSPNTAVAGTQTVTVNVSAGSETNISRVQVRLNDIVACEQTFTPPLAPTQGVAQIVCPIATAAINPDGTPVWLNGTYQLTAVAMSGDAVVATANYGNLIFANANVVGAVIRTDGNSAIGGATSVAPGLMWNEGNVIVEARPTLYTGGSIASVRVCLNANGAAIPTANSVAVPAGTICRTATTSTDNMFSVTFPKSAAHTTAAAGLGVAGVEAQNMSAGVTTITAAGTTGPGGNSNLINLDNLAPVVTSLIINANQYVNGSFMFAGAAGCTTPPYTGTCFAMTDLGSNSATAVFNVQTVGGTTVTGGADVANPAGLEETPTSNERILQAVVTDAVGNTRTVYGSAAGAPSTTVAGASRFGIDLTDPTITVASGPANNSSNPSTNVYDFTFIDAGIGPSGFGPTPLRIRVEQFTPNGTGGVTRICIHPTTGAQLGGAGAGCTVNGGFVTVADAGADVILPFGTVDAYWQVTARVVDFAGNVSSDVVRVTMDDQVAPVVGNIITPTSITGGTQVTFSAQMQDNVELGDQLGYVGYNAIGLFLVTGRDILATYGFDELSTPRNATHTIDQFIRSVETTAGNAPSGMIATATDMNLAVRDMAGMQTSAACPAAGVVGTQEPAGPFLPGSCRTVQTSIINAISLGMGGAAETSWGTAGRPFGTNVGAGNTNYGGIAFTNTTTTAPVCSNIPVGANAGCNVVTAMTKTLSATATGPAQTFANPFQRVNFYYTDTQGRSHLIGTASVSVTDNTVTNIRTWTYTVTWNPNAMGVPANAGYPIFALGIDAQGRALQTSSVLVPVTSD